MISRGAQKLKHTLIILVDSSSSKARTFSHASFSNNGLSDLDTLVSKIPIGSNEDEVVETLSKDINCNNVQLTHQLFDELLHRFKDNWISALGVFRWAQTRSGYEPSPEAYDHMLEILWKMRQKEKMNLLLREMRDQNLIMLESVGKVMRRFSGAGQWEEAVSLFDELGSFGLEKNVDSMNLLLDALCKANKVDKAREIFLQSKPLISPNLNTFNIFINGWCKVGRVEEAYWTVKEMKGLGFRPCVLSYSTIVKFHCLRGEFNAVYKVLDEMQIEGCSPNIITHTTIMSCLAKLDKFDDALKIAERVKSSGCKPDTLFYNSLIHVLGKAGKIDEAIRVFEAEMPDNGVVANASTFNTMIAMFCHHREEQKALNILEKMENSGLCKPDVQSYFPLLKSCFRTGKTDDLLPELLDSMLKKHHLCLNIQTYNLLIHGLVRANNCEWASLLFEEMIGRGLKPRYKMCQLLVKEAKHKYMINFAVKIENFVCNMKNKPL